MDCVERTIMVKMGVSCTSSCDTETAIYSCLGSATGLPDTYVDPPRSDPDETCIADCGRAPSCDKPLGCPAM